MLLLLAAVAYAQDLVGSTGCNATSCVLANSNLRFGTGAENSVNAWGLFQQPWYYSRVSSGWFKLTYSNFPLDTAIGTGTGSPNWSGANAVDIYSLASTASVTDYSGFVVDSSDTAKSVGHGLIQSSRVFTLLGQLITIHNVFSLGLNDSFVKVTTRIINNSTTMLRNVIIWAGTRDDYVGSSDVNTKTRGNLNASGFFPVTSNSQISRAIMITNPIDGILFYSDTEGVMTAYSACCSFSNVYNTYPLSLAPSTGNPTDGSYAAVLPLGNITVNSSGTITWYYAAGSINSLSSSVAQSVAVAQIAANPDIPLSDTATPTQTRTRTGTSTQTPTGTGTGTSTQTPTGTTTRSVSSTPTPTAAPTPTAISIRVFINDTIVITPITNIYQTIAENGLVYAFIPINVIFILCCFAAAFFYAWRTRKVPRPAFGIIEQLVAAAEPVFTVRTPKPTKLR